jgi:hypothetical protein
MAGQEENQYMAQPIRHTLQEGTVDTGKEHIKIVYGDGMIPVCVLQPQGDAFIVQFMVREDETNRRMIADVWRDLKLQLIDKRMPSTWRYAIIHCGTIENIFSPVHWIHKAVE